MSGRSFNGFSSGNLKIRRRINVLGWSPLNGQGFFGGWPVQAPYERVPSPVHALRRNQAISDSHRLLWTRSLAFRSSGKPKFLGIGCQFKDTAEQSVLASVLVRRKGANAPRGVVKNREDAFHEHCKKVVRSSNERAFIWKLRAPK